MYDLRTIRDKRQLTQQDLAQLSGLPQSHIASIENGQYLPQNRTRKRIERVLGCPVNWLTTYARDRGNIGHVLTTLINSTAPGADERILFCRQYLSELEKMMK